MKFGPRPTGQALGCILAHSVRLETRRLGKGTLLGAAEIAALQEAGIASVTVAEPETGDVAEDDAAAQLAAASTMAAASTVPPPPPAPTGAL